MMNNRKQIFQIEQIREDLEKLLPWQLSQFHDAIAETVRTTNNPGECRACREKIIWTKSPAGQRIPLNYIDGEKHTKTCPEASYNKIRHSPSASIMGQCKCTECWHKS